MILALRRVAVPATLPFIGVVGALALAVAAVVIVIVVAVLACMGHPPQIKWGNFSLKWPSDRRGEGDDL